MKAKKLRINDIKRVNVFQKYACFIELKIQKNKKKKSNK